MCDNSAEIKMTESIWKMEKSHKKIQDSVE